MSSAAGGVPPSPRDEFAAEMIGLVREVLGLTATRQDDFALRVEMPDGRAFTINLQNIYTESQQAGAGEGRERQLRRAVLGMVPEPRPATWADAAPRLMPVVRSASWANAMRPGQASSVLSGPFGRPLVPFLKVLCAIDFEYSMTYVTADDLAAWGVSDDDATAAAAANLARLPCEVRRYGALTEFLGPEGYASSWLAAPAMLAKGAAQLGSTVVAVAPSRDRLVLIDGDYPGIVRLLEAALEDYQEAARQLSPVPYLVSAARIEPWQPPEGHPARAVADKAARYLALIEYGHQEELLGDVLQKAGEDVHVARHTLMARPDGTLWSWTAWVKQVSDGLLPRADVVVFGDSSGQAGQFAARWDDTLRLAGDALLEEAQYDPPRWRHHGWPDTEALERLRACAVPLPP